MDMYYFKEPNSSLLAKAIKVGSKWEEDVMPFVEELGKVIFIGPDLTKKQKKKYGPIL